jgi:hypothetical protein
VEACRLHLLPGVPARRGHQGTLASCGTSVALLGDTGSDIGTARAQSKSIPQTLLDSAGLLCCPNH